MGTIGRAVSLKKALSLLGYTVVQYSKNYNYRSGFMLKDGQLYYFSYEDLRESSPTLLVRTADASIKNRKGEYADFRGGINTYPNQDLIHLGYKIVEPRQSCDFNSN